MGSDAFKDGQSILKYFSRIDKCRESLSEFIKLAWHVVEPGANYIHGWHIDAVCEHLEAVTCGNITRLAINIPPGCMKSLMINVFFPAWEWGPRGLDHYRYLTASHNIDLAIRDNIILKKLVTSDWYKNYFPNLKLVSSSYKKFSNSKNGFSQALPAGSMTGSRGDRVKIDDPLSVEDSESDAILLSRERWFTESVPTRLVDPKKSAIILIMQRLKERDTTGVALSKNLGYELLMLPMEFEPNRKCRTSIGFSDPRTEENELLFPERFSREVVDRDKKALGSYAIACQFQQCPTPREGAIIKLDWLANRFIMPKDEIGRVRLNDFRERYQSWDTAFKDGEQNDYSVCTTFGIKDNGFYVLNVFRMRCDFPTLEKKVIELAQTWNPNQILIEDKASGQSLIQAVKKRTNLPVKAVKIDRDKIARLNAVTGYFEAMRVWLPEKEPWIDTFINELTTFPAAVHDDQVDTVSQFFLEAVLRREGAAKMHIGSTIYR